MLATGNYTVYTYDAENRLIKVEEFAAGNPTAFATSTYRYDGLGRRIQKTLSTQSSALSTSYVYDGEDILLEYDGTNALVARYTHGPGIDEPIAVTKGGNTFFYHQDGLGTVTDITDSAGVTAKSYSYDAYGNIVESPGTIEQPYTYTGREFDSESGLYYYRARYYDSMTGRFLQKDIIGLRGGINRYRYVDNDPTNYTDPFGLLNLPGDPSGLPPGWQPDPSHQDPNGERWRHPSGDYLDFHKGRSDQEWWRGKDHWHHNGDKKHHVPGDEIPDPTPEADGSKDPPCGKDCQNMVPTVIMGATGAYIVYRCVRLIPSLFPPLWWTLPGNVVTP